MELRMIIKCIQIVPFIIGVIGSMLIIRIMLRPVFRKMPRHLTCIALATVDLLLLMWTFCMDLFEMITGLNPLVGNMVLCKVYLPLLVYLTHMDSWLITVLTFDRLLAVMSPFRVNQIVTTFRTKVLLVMLTTFFFVSDIEMGVRLTYFKEGVPRSNLTAPVCQWVNYNGLPPQILVIKDGFMVLCGAFIPIALIVPTNVIIIIKVYRQNQARAAMTSAMAQNYKEMSKTLWMVIGASLAFVLTITPFSVYGLILFVTNAKEVRTDVYALFLEMISRLNPALNAYIYFMCGGLFKVEVISWIASVCSCKCYQTSGLGNFVELTMRKQPNGGGQSAGRDRRKNEYVINAIYE